MLDFPANPTNGQIFTPVVGGPSWQWDSQKWVAATTGSVTYAPITDPVFQGNPQAPQPAAGDADASIATTKFVSDAVATSLHDVGRNYLHNSMFNVAQRGAGPWATVSGYTADRWNFLMAGGSAYVVLTPVSDAAKTQIGDEAAVWCWQNNFAGGAGAGDYQIVIQPIEGVRRLSGKTVTLSFWANTSGTPKVGIEFVQNFGTGGSPSLDVSTPAGAITLSNTWARYSVTKTLPSASSPKVFGSNGNDHTDVYIWMSAGSTNATRASSIGQQSATFQFWGVQLELGPTATPLEKLDPVTDLQRCQRFYLNDTAIAFQAGFNSWAGGGFTTLPFSFPVAMRALPQVALGTLSGQTNIASVTAVTISQTRFLLQVSSTAAGGTGVTVQGFTASADL